MISYSDFQWSKPTTVSFPGGTVRNVTFDGLQRLQTIHTRNQAGETLMQHDYQYDEVGNVLGRTTEHGNYVYAYDELDRLVNASYPTLEPEAFEYDPVNNRTEHSRTGESSWQYNANDELLNSVENQWEYDKNGSAVEKRHSDGTLEHHYVHNLEGRIAEIYISDSPADETLLAKYYYDPFGRRLWNQVEGSTTYFTYTNEGYGSELDGAGDVEPLVYQFHPDALWSTDPVFRKEGTIYYFYQTDHLKAPMQLVSNTGTKVHSRELSALGMVVGAGVVDDSLRLPGQRKDRKTGDFYNYHRQFNADVGRYLSLDPARSRSVGTLYSYPSNPLLQVDPWGLVAWTGSMRSLGTGKKFDFKYKVPPLPVSVNFYYITLCSECVDGYAWCVEVEAWAAGAGLGPPIGGNVTDLNLEDGMSRPDPAATYHYTNGSIWSFKIASGTAAFGESGGGCTAIRTGIAQGAACGGAMGFDASLDAAWGQANYKSLKQEDLTNCGECEEWNEQLFGG